MLHQTLRELGHKVIPPNSVVMGFHGDPKQNLLSSKVGKLARATLPFTAIRILWPLCFSSFFMVFGEALLLVASSHSRHSSMMFHASPARDIALSPLHRAAFWDSNCASSSAPLASWSSVLGLARSRHSAARILIWIRLGPCLLSGGPRAEYNHGVDRNLLWMWYKYWCCPHVLCLRLRRIIPMLVVIEVAIDGPCLEWARGRASW